MNPKLLSVIVIAMFIYQCKGTDPSYLRGLPIDIPPTGPPVDTAAFDIFPTYPKNVSNIDNMYLKCEWFEQDDISSEYDNTDDCTQKTM
ncbi:hypothetical protein BDFB_009036 [Asbolus verrucosus]|uniref:Uncharacterized protein n=1 Tax=Asbolus verrucosus TaxID=1661398 RepID=A0A482VU17_ASBVE|nr:hypothetical protein BDFB_009036 [Asbolus verrucosus]